MHKLDKSFKAVLDIPLSRVYICTLHALCRIIEKLVYLYICFAWMLNPKEGSTKAIKDIEGVLSNIGLHGGEVGGHQAFKGGGVKYQPNHQ